MPVHHVVVQATGQAGELCREHHADGDRRTVAPAVPLDVLDRMPEGVPVVEDLPQAGLAQVLADDLGLHRDGPLDELEQDVGACSRDRVLQEVEVRLDQVEDHRVGDEPCLDHLGEPGDEVVGRHRLQRREVAQHAGRRVEGPDQVLSLGRVDARLAADGGIHHREHGGGQLDHAHTAQPRRGDEAREVGGRAPTDPDDGIGPGEPCLAQHLPAEGGDLGGLRLLGVRHLGTERLVAALAQVGQHGVRGGRESCRMHDENPLHVGTEQVRQRAEQVPADHHLVGPLPRHTYRPGLAHACSSWTARAPASRC